MSTVKNIKNDSDNAGSIYIYGSGIEVPNAGTVPFFTPPKQLEENFKLGTNVPNKDATRDAVVCGENDMPVNATKTITDDSFIENPPKKENDLVFSVPDWGYDDFIYERQSWVKGLDSITGDPGLFYFKIFFHFDTSSGLFGNILNNKNTNGLIDNKKGDCASRYLEMNMNSGRYATIALADKYSALRKFVMSLSFISSSAPWFFNSISGLDKAINPALTKPMDQRSIEIECRQDAIDMRLTTLLDLYRYAAYDYVNLKEILPQNLRQFDMTICLFHSPITWLDTGMKSIKNTYQYRRMNSFISENSTKGLDNTMSYKMITLKGCEFDVESTNANVPPTISNDQGFELGRTKIRINFKRSFSHTFNSYGQFVIGDDAAYYDSQRVSDVTKDTKKGLFSTILNEAAKAFVGAQSGRLGEIGDAMYSPANSPVNFASNLTKVSEAKYVDATEELITNITGLYYPSIVDGNWAVDNSSGAMRNNYLYY